MNLLIKPMFFQLIFLMNFALANSNLDIIRDTGADFVQRANALRELQLVLKKEQPLPVKDAIAELCYDVDICARGSTIDFIQEECENTRPVGDYRSFFGDACYTKNIREEYTCNPQKLKMDLNFLSIFSRLMGDATSLYINQIDHFVLDFYKTNFNVDLSIPENFDSFVIAYPKEAKRIKSASQSAYALAAYTTNCYDSINRFLYLHDKTNLQRYFNIYTSIINLLEYIPVYRGMVNRGVRLPLNVLQEHHKVGNIVCNDGFTSTAAHDPGRDYGVNPRNQFLSGKCTQRLFINIPAESKAKSYSINSLSISKGEEEVLFIPGSCFRIDKVTKRIIDEQDDEYYECNELQTFNFEMTAL
jgi:hypothetical protein